MHNTIGDVTPTNTSRETNYFQDFVQYPKQKFSPFLFVIQPNGSNIHRLHYFSFIQRDHFEI